MSSSGPLSSGNKTEGLILAGTRQANGCLITWPYAEEKRAFGGLVDHLRPSARSKQAQKDDVHLDYDNQEEEFTGPARP
jgi:hypothetical protein